MRLTDTSFNLILQNIGRVPFKPTVLGGEFGQSPYFEECFAAWGSISFGMIGVQGLYGARFSQTPASQIHARNVFKLARRLNAHEAWQMATFSGPSTAHRLTFYCAGCQTVKGELNLSLALTFGAQPKPGRSSNGSTRYATGSLGWGCVSGPEIDTVQLQDTRNTRERSHSQLSKQL